MIKFFSSINESDGKRVNTVLNFFKTGNLGKNLDRFADSLPTSKEAKGLIDLLASLGSTKLIKANFDFEFEDKNKNKFILALEFIFRLPGAPEGDGNVNDSTWKIFVEGRPVTRELESKVKDLIARNDLKYDSGYLNIADMDPALFFKSIESELFEIRDRLLKLQEMINISKELFFQD